MSLFGAVLGEIVASHAFFPRLSMDLCRKGADVAQLSVMLECDAMDIAHHRNHEEVKRCLVSFGAVPIADE